MPESINYIIISNFSFYFNIQSNSSKSFHKYDINLTLSLNEYLIPQGNYGIINLSNISYYDEDIPIKYSFNESKMNIYF